jgi:hypothetical protein
MFKRKPRIRIVRHPRVGILDLGGEASKEFVKSDSAFLRLLFGDVLITDLTVPNCDVLFLYATLRSDGVVIGSLPSLREIIRDSGATVVVVALGNPGANYIRAGQPSNSYGQANLVMTLDRKGESFERYFRALFSKMLGGISMPVAWNQLSPQIPGVNHGGSPDVIFACELGQLSFE